MADDEEVAVVSEEEEVVRKTKEKKRYFLAFDPGLTNLAVWAGTIDRKGMPRTRHLAKFDVVTKEKGKKATKPVYEGVADMILDTPWMINKERIKSVVVETQQQRNFPARIAATSIYGLMRGLGIDVQFSGAMMKNKAMDHLSKKLKIELKEKPKPLPKEADPKEKKQRQALMHKINKDNSKAIVEKMLISMKETLPKSHAIMAEAFEKAGKKKDDLSDAILLGLGLALHVTPHGKRH